MRARSQGESGRAGAAEGAVDAPIALPGGERGTSLGVVLLASLPAEALEHGRLGQADEVHVDGGRLLEEGIVRDVCLLSFLTEVTLVQRLVQDGGRSLGWLSPEVHVDSGPAEESAGAGRLTIVVSLGSSRVRTEGLVAVSTLFVQEKASTLGSLSMSVLTKEARQRSRGSRR